MPEIIGALVLGFVIGLIVGGCMAYSKGWNAGVDWARAQIWGS